MTKQLQACDWQFNLYTDYTVNSTTTVSHARFGSSTYNSNMGIAVAVAKESAIQMFRFSSGDFVGLILGPYIDILGPMFYALILLGMCASLQRRYGHTGPIIVTFLLFAGPGSVLLAVIPQIAIIPLAAIMLIAAGFMLWRILRQ